MIHPSTFLSRALLADAIFSGVAAVALTLGAGALAPFLNLPEALLRETGLFLIAYTALVGWLATRSAVAKALVLLVIVPRGRSAASRCCSRARCRRTCSARSLSWPRRLRRACSPSCNISGCARAVRRWRPDRHCERSEAIQPSAC